MFFCRVKLLKSPLNPSNTDAPLLFISDFFYFWWKLHAAFTPVPRACIYKFCALFAEQVQTWCTNHRIQFKVMICSARSLTKGAKNRGVWGSAQPSWGIFGFWIVSVQRSAINEHLNVSSSDRGAVFLGRRVNISLRHFHPHDCNYVFDCALTSAHLLTAVMDAQWTSPFPEDSSVCSLVVNNQWWVFSLAVVVAGAQPQSRNSLLMRHDLARRQFLLLIFVPEPYDLNVCAANSKY